MSDAIYDDGSPGQHRAWAGGFEFAWMARPNGMVRYWVVPSWPLLLPVAALVADEIEDSANARRKLPEKRALVTIPAGV